MARARLLAIILVIALLLGGVALWQWRAHERDGSAALGRGIAALDRGDMRSARVELMNAIKADPRSIVARTAQARVLAALGDGAGAQAEVERVRAMGASPANSRAVMAQALLLQGDVDGALREANAPDMPEALKVEAARVAARALIRRGDLPGAHGALAFALKNAPDDAENWIDLARLNLASGDQATAIMTADRAIAIAPGNVEALTLRAELVRSQYGLTASLPWFDKALAADPANVATLESYAATLADAGRASPMLSLTRRILALDPDNARAWLMQSVMAARAGRDDLARSLLERTRGRLDGEPATRLLRGVLNLQEGNAVLAVEALAPLVAQQPDNRTARTLLGRAFYLAGDYPSAATILAPIVSQRDAEPYVLTLAARAQEAMGQRAMAADMLARAAWPSRPSADPFVSPADAAIIAAPPADVTTARDNIPYIRALLSAGEAQAALARARQLNAANPGAPDAWIILGDTLVATGQPGEAGRVYEAAANIRFDRAVALRMAAAWARAGDPARAWQVLQLFLSQNPGDPEAMRLAAASAMRMQDWRNALKMLHALEAQSGTQDAILMADIARASMENGDRKAALAYAAHAYRLMPANPMTADIYGWVLMQAGEKGPAAVDLLEKAVALAPGYPVLQLHLGQAYAAAGQVRDAKPLLSRAAAAPGFDGRQQARDALAAL